jgi:hypothetical protein
MALTMELFESHDISKDAVAALSMATPLKMSGWTP